MVKLLTVMGWNIENFGSSKYTKCGAELVEFIAQVIDQNHVDIAAFSEMRSNLAGQIGQDIAAELNMLQGVASWVSHPSIQLVPKRLEQYLFVRNSNLVTTYNGAPNGTPYQWLYTDPTNPPKKIGFPRQISSDRPPFLGYFRVTDSTMTVRQVLIAVMHSPGPGAWKDTRDAGKNMALVTEFNNNGDTCVIVGDFNIKYQTDAAVVNSNGEAGFGDLVNANFDQAMNPIDAATSLIDAVYWTPPPAMAVGDYQNEPYDQVFFRTTGVAALNYQPAYTDDLIQECINGNYLEAPLGAIIDAYAGNPANTTAYGGNINNAFVDYRLYVSDHLPVFIQVDE